jgi:ribonuclease P protein component
VEGVLRLQREYRLKRRNDFRKVFRAGNSFANRQFVVYVFKRAERGPIRLGISVSKKIGNAVTRNRVRRLVKEISRHWVTYLSPQSDIVVIARKPVANMDYHQVKSSLQHVYTRAKLFEKQPPS